jgi:hypothetical protein
VPTHFFKVVLQVTRKNQNISGAGTGTGTGVGAGTGTGAGVGTGAGAGTHDSIEEYSINAAAFLLPNRNIDTKLPLETFSISMHDLESLVGMTFFDKLLSTSAKQQLDTPAPQLRTRRYVGGIL